MNKFTTIILIIFIFPLFTFAQTGEVQRLHVIKKEPYSKIDGSPYYLDWGVGNIILKDGTIYQDLKLNYDIYKAQIHVESKLQGLVAVHSELIESVAITNEDGLHLLKPFKSSDVGLTINQGGDIKIRIYEVIYEGEKYGYYKLPIKIFQKDTSPETEKAYTVDDTEGTFNARQKYFLRFPDGKFTIVPPRKKAFISAFGEDGETLKSYIKKEKPIFSQFEDIKKMLAYMENNTNN